MLIRENYILSRWWEIWNLYNSLLRLQFEHPWLRFKDLIIVIVQILQGWYIKLILHLFLIWKLNSWSNQLRLLIFLKHNLIVNFINKFNLLSLFLWYPQSFIHVTLWWCACCLDSITSLKCCSMIWSEISVKIRLHFEIWLIRWHYSAMGFNVCNFTCLIREWWSNSFFSIWFVSRELSDCLRMWVFLRLKFILILTNWVLSTVHKWITEINPLIDSCICIHWTLLRSLTPLILLFFILLKAFS